MQYLYSCAVLVFVCSTCIRVQYLYSCAVLVLVCSTCIRVQYLYLCAVSDSQCSKCDGAASAEALDHHDDDDEREDEDNLGGGLTEPLLSLSVCLSIRLSLYPSVSLSVCWF